MLGRDAFRLPRGFSRRVPALQFLVAQQATTLTRGCPLLGRGLGPHKELPFSGLTGLLCRGGQAPLGTGAPSSLLRWAHLRKKEHSKSPPRTELTGPPLEVEKVAPNKKNWGESGLHGYSATSLVMETLGKGQSADLHLLLQHPL